MKIQTTPLPYISRLEPRQKETISLVVIHCTELPDLSTAREYGEQVHYEGSKTGNSGHYYVDRDGSIHCWVPADRVAHHTAGYNQRSIGIELVNLGRWPYWFNSEKQQMNEPYPEKQIQALIALLQHLQAELKSLNWIAGHEDLDLSRIAASDSPGKLVKRKLDPGPHFPWDRVIDLSGLITFDAESE
ncbi:MAG: N-acetylmuramoyl-L-alanine amidase [Rhodothermales bacterium]